MSCAKKPRLDDEGVNAEGPGGEAASAGAAASSAQTSPSEQPSGTIRAIRDRHRDCASFPETRSIVRLPFETSKQLIPGFIDNPPANLSAKKPQSPRSSSNGSARSLKRRSPADERPRLRDPHRPAGLSRSPTR